MARGLISKAIRGAANAGVPMLKAEHEAQIMAKRDATLRGYGIEDREDTQSFQAEQNQQQQEFTASENQLGREQQQSQFEATSDMQGRQLALNEQQVNATLRASEIALQEAELGLVEKQQVNGLRETIMDENRPAEEREQARQKLDTFLGNNDEFRAITLYGDDDGLGNQMRSSGVLNTRTGRIQGATPPNRDDDPLGLRQ